MGDHTKYPVEREITDLYASYSANKNVIILVHGNRGDTDVNATAVAANNIWVA